MHDECADTQDLSFLVTCQVSREVFLKIYKYALPTGLLGQGKIKFEDNKAVYIRTWIGFGLKR